MDPRILKSNNEWHSKATAFEADVCACEIPKISIKRAAFLEEWMSSVQLSSTPVCWSTRPMGAKKLRSYHENQFTLCSIHLIIGTAALLFSARQSLFPPHTQPVLSWIPVSQRKPPNPIRYALYTKLLSPPTQTAHFKAVLLVLAQMSSPLRMTSQSLLFFAWNSNAHHHCRQRDHKHSDFRQATAIPLPRQAVVRPPTIVSFTSVILKAS